MKNYDIKNQFVLDILDKIKYNYIDKYHLPTLMKQCGKADLYYISDEYRDKLIAMGVEHKGSASRGLSYPIKPENLLVEQTDPLYWQYRLDWMNIDHGLKEYLGLASCALAQYYPPEGHIEWHNNADAPSHNLIFTWSETGDGWFKWYDLKKKENVVMQDVAGWTLKAGYFSSYEQPEKVLYHSAYTKCRRLTVSYTLGHDTEYWKDCIQVISED
jgi:hypothetical protein